MIAQVALEIALGKEFDYLVPAGLESSIEVGSRVKVPFGRRQVFGYVTAFPVRSAHPKLRAIVQIAGGQSLVTPLVLRLARWMADYYCCPFEVVLKSVVPVAVRKEQAGWKTQLMVRLQGAGQSGAKLTSRQRDILGIVEEWREISMQRLIELSGSTAPTIRRLEDKGLIRVAPQVTERDPYAEEEILPTESLPLNPEQARALSEIIVSLERSARMKQKPGVTSISAPASQRPAANPSRAPAEARPPPPHLTQTRRAYFVAWKTAAGLRLPPALRAKVLEACYETHGRKFKCLVASVLPEEVQLIVEPLPLNFGHEKNMHSVSEILHTVRRTSASHIQRELQKEGPAWSDKIEQRTLATQPELETSWNAIWQAAERAVDASSLSGKPVAWIPPDFQKGNSSRGWPRSGDASESELPGLERSATAALLEAPAESPRQTAEEGKPLLLHGVTGSGKTEVYLQAIAHSLSQGKGAIVLVPEISLTPQTVERFKARFSSPPLKTLVAVLHSRLSAGERHDEWHKIRQGRARIVIGARSAVFAPVQALGLIVVDEEHEPSYKQEEAPRYQARDLAVVRAQMEGAVVVLGSATPSLESFYNCRQGKYRLIELPRRADEKTMPLVRIIDMRQEARKEKGAPIFSQKLKEAIHRRLEKSEQTMLFLNRRGFASSLQCTQCGYVAGCPNCSVALTYHRALQKLLCHICGHSADAPVRCPEPACANPAIRYAGLGTEKVEEALVKLFPKARVKRMDSDALKRKDDYRRFLGDFRRGKTDILLGTQMIAKGLHFPNVTLVGIIYADLSLHQPDFRAGERTFQLLTQVAGRAGRGAVEGEVIIQAFTPFHPAIQYARRHDFVSFYEQEIEFREQLGYPPLKRAALLTLKGRNEDKVKFSAAHLRKEIAPIESRLSDLTVSGPAPAPLARLETFYRYQIFLRTRQMSQLSRGLMELQLEEKLPEEVRLTVDIDPVNLA